MPTRRERINEVLGRYNHLKKRMVEEQEALKQAQANLLARRDALDLAQSVGQTLQEYVHRQIAAVVSKCLEAVFVEPYQFQIIFERKRGKTDARLVFIRDGQEIDPTSASGGGVVDVASFALRTACLLLVRPSARRVLVLDEPFKHLSDNYIPAVRELMQWLSEDMKIQFIMVTHHADLAWGKVVEL